MRRHDAVLMIANDRHVRCFQVGVARGLAVYANSPPAPVNFCTVHNSWTSLLLPILKGKILPNFLVRYCRKMTHFNEPDFLSRAQMFRHVVRLPLGYE